MSTAVNREPRLAKNVIPANSLKDQASIALYFEYTQGRTVVEKNGETIVRLNNVALFAVDRHLLTKTHTARYNTATRTFRVDQYQSQFRDSTRSGLSFPLSPQDAFLTVMEAWEYATARDFINHEPHPDDTNSLTAVTAVVSEPLMYSVSADATEALREDPENLQTARKLSREAETMWRSLAIADNHAAIPPAASGLDKPLRTFIDYLTSENSGNPYKELPADRPAPRTIHPDLIALAHGTKQWA